MTGRTARLDELLQQEISRIVARDVRDPRVGFVTITRVEVTPDLRHARVWVSIIGQPDERRAAFLALAHSMPFVRRELGVLRLRRIPDLHLQLDDSVERGTRVLRILEDLESGREPDGSVPGETLPTPGPRPVVEAPNDATADAAPGPARGRRTGPRHAPGLRGAPGAPGAPGRRRPPDRAKGRGT
jgi:ribosome-binding factor A